MRGRSWRKEQEDRVFRKRIQRFSKRWYHFTTANGDNIQNPHWIDFIGLPDFYFYKSGTTRMHDSRWKNKYSPNKSRDYYRDPKARFLSTGKREGDKILVMKIIKEYYEERGNNSQE